MAFFPPPYFAMPAPQAPGLVGKLTYRYVTRDGGPPNKGAPPSSTPSSGPSPAYCSGPPSPYCMAPGFGPPSGQPGPFMVPPGNGFPGAFCVPNSAAPPPPAPPSGPTPTWFPPAPPPPPAPLNVAGAAAPAANPSSDPPVSGNRVKDNLLVVKDSGGVGHIASKNNATFHIFTENIFDKYTPNASNQFWMPVMEKFRSMTAAYYMPIHELIEQLDCVKNAPPGYPREQIGLAEVFERGNGWFDVGTKIFLGDARANLTIKEAWGDSIGEQGRSRPKWLVLFPGKRGST